MNVMVESEEMSENGREKEDEISKAIGAFGVWQTYLTILLSLFNVPSTWHIYVPTFYTPVTNALNKTTVASEFDLSGDRAAFATLAETMFLSGVAIGGVVSGLISDRYGRKRVLLASALVQSILALLLVFAQNIQTYVMVRAALGFVCISVVISAFVLAIELVAGRFRLIVGVLFLLPVSFGYISISCLAWAIQNWRHLQLLIAFSGFLLFAIGKQLIPESPRWLLATNKTEVLIQVLKQASQANKLKRPEFSDGFKFSTEKYQKVKIGDLFGTRHLTRITLLSFVMWFSLYLVYYGLVLKMDRIGSNIYIDTIISGCVEIVAVVLTVIVLLKFGSRNLTAATYLIAGVSCLLTGLLLAANTDALFVVMSGKFSISSTNAVMPLLTSEMYPTRMRNLGVGACNVPAGIALILIPHLWKQNSSFPMYLLGLMAVMGSICTLLLPRNLAAEEE